MTYSVQLYVTDYGYVPISDQELQQAGLRWGRGSWKTCLVPLKIDALLHDFLGLAMLDARMEDCQ